MKKVFVLLCLMSFQVGASDILLNCTKHSARVQKNLKLIDTSAIYGPGSVMAIQSGLGGESFLYGNKVMSPNSPLSFYTVAEYELSDSKGSKFIFEVQKKTSPSRACSPRAGSCDFPLKYITAKLSGVDVNASYTCY